MNLNEAVKMAERIIKENKNPSWGDLATMASHDEMVACIAALYEAVKKPKKLRKKS